MTMNYRQLYTSGDAATYAGDACNSCPYEIGGVSCEYADGRVHGEFLPPFERVLFADADGGVCGACGAIAAELKRAGAEFFRGVRGLDVWYDGARDVYAFPQDIVRIDGNLYPRCEADNAVYCNDREELIFFDDAVFLEDVQEWVSYEWASYECYRCADCGKWYRWQDSGSWDADDEWYCNDCARAAGEIGSYHAARSRGFTPRGADVRRLGFELEAEGDNRRAAAAAVLDIVGDAASLEEDGSVDGFEIVSQPHDWEALATFPLEQVCECLRARHWRSHDGGHCGFHVHASREWLGETADEQERRAGKIVKFYRMHSRDLIKLSRREAGRLGYCDFSGDPGGVDMLPASEVVDAKKCAGRYAPVNLQNWDGLGTLEFRLCRGSLVASSLRAWLDICRAVLLNSATCKPWDRLADWFEGVSEATRAYIEARGVDMTKEVE